MKKFYLPVPFLVLLFNTIAFCQQRPLGMLSIPSSLANQEKINLNYTNYYTLGYEPMVGDAVMECGSWDGFTDKIRIWMRLRMSFTRPTKFVIYKEGKGALKSITGTPDPKVQMSALSVKMPVSYKGTALKTLEFHFGFDELGNLKADDELFIPASLLKNYDKVGTATKIAGGSKEEVASIFTGLSLGTMTVTHFEYFKFTEQAKTEAGKLNDADLALRRKEEDDRKKAEADKRRLEDEEKKKKLAAEETAKKKAVDEAATREKTAAGTKPASGTGTSTGLTISSSSGTAAGSRTITSGTVAASAATSSTLTKQQQDAQLMAATQQKLQQMTTDFQNQQLAIQRKAEQTSALMMQSYYAAEAVRTGKANLTNASTLSGNYSSIEDLEAEFNQKYAAINAEVNSLNDARNQQLQATYNSLYSDASETNKAIGQAGVAIGNFINNLKAEKEEREAKEALRRQREAAKAEIESRKRAAMIQLRTGFFNEFPDGGVPLSGHKVTTNELYFFSYVFDKTKIDAGPAAVKVSNVFPIARYGDGTWPFKTAVVGDVKKAAADNKEVTLVGYYASKEMADKMRGSFLNLASKCQITVKDITYKGKKSSGGATTDFWGTGSIKKAALADSSAAPVQLKKKDDFWMTGGAKKAVADTTKKSGKTNDFWNH